MGGVKALRVLTHQKHSQKKVCVDRKETEGGNFKKHVTGVEVGGHDATQY